jgi:hypothetical protein
MAEPNEPANDDNDAKTPNPPDPKPAPSKNAPAAGSDDGFPTGVSVKDMTPDEQVAFWRHQAKTWEQRATGNKKDVEAAQAELEKLKQAGMSDQEKAIAQQVQAAREQATSEITAKYQTRMVNNAIRAEARAGGLDLTDEETATKLATFTASLNPQAFLTEDGDEIDSEKVKTVIGSWVQGQDTARKGYPDYQSHIRQNIRKGTGVDSGEAEAAARAYTQRKGIPYID